MAILDLYVNGFDATKDAWTKVGASPYLDAQDQPTNYVHSSSKKAECGDFDFADSGKSTETINSVYLYVYLKSDDKYGVKVFLWDGSVWNELDFSGTQDWGWKNVDVSSILDSWTKIDGAKIYIKNPNTAVYKAVDAAYLKVDYTAGAFTPKSHNWRWYENDGAEPTNPLANENVKPTNIARNDKIRLRVCIHETGGLAGSNQDLQVEYSINQTDWIPVGAQAATDKSWRWADGLATEHNTVTGGKLSCQDELGLYHELACTDGVDIGASKHHEMDITIENYGASPDETYYFRIKLEGTVVPLEDPPNSYPQVQTKSENVSEDFTVYTEVDPNSQITIASPTHIDFDNYQDELTDSYVYDDKGVNYFDGDFEHLIDIQLTGWTEIGYESFFPWIMSNDIDDMKGLRDADLSHFEALIYRDALLDKVIFKLQETDGADDYFSESASISVTLPKWFYLKISRDESVGAYGTLYLKVYNNAARTDLAASISVALHSSKKDFRYIFALQSYNADNPARNVSGDIENLNLQEAVAVTEKSFSDAGAGSDGFVNPFRAMGFDEVGGGVDSFVNPFRAMGFSEVGSGLDVFNTPYREMGFSDVGLGTDIFFLLQEKSFSDVGLGTDVFSIVLKALGFSDVGQGIDSFAIPFKAMGFVDMGLGSDVFVIPYKELGFADIGTGLDAFGVIVFRSFGDVGVGVDVFTIPFRAMGFSDVGSGLDVFTKQEILAVIEKFFSDVGIGSDVFNIVFKALGFSDQGIGTDVFRGAVLIEPPALIFTVDGKIILRISSPTKEKPDYVYLGG